MSDLPALIAKLEAATGPSRELDGLVWCMLNGVKFQHAFADYYGRATQVAFTRPPKRTREVSRSGQVLNYTASLDDALTLVPEGPWGGEICWGFGNVAKGGYVELNKANPAWLVPDSDEAGWPDEHAACADSYSDQGADYKPRPLALALCIAIMKARIT